MMEFIVYGCILIGVVLVVVILVSRRRLKRMRNELTERLEHVVPMKEAAVLTDEGVAGAVQNGCNDRRGDVEADTRRVWVDMETDIEETYRGIHISGRLRANVVAFYAPIYQEATALIRKLKRFDVEPTPAMVKLVMDYGSMDNIIRRHNARLEDEALQRYGEFFDHCMKYPLDEQQRRSIVSEEDNCLVVSSAGSGKTSSIVGKVRYLTDILKVKPENILLISYTNKAAAELTERMNIAELRGYTFHKLAMDLIGKITGEKPSIYDSADALIVKIYHDLVEGDKNLRKSVVEYMGDYRQEAPEGMDRARMERLQQEKQVQIHTGLPDMDGKEIVVRSEEEKKVVFALASLGVKFRYEEPYEMNVADEEHSQYRPDFSIHFVRKEQPCRLYLEHFGVNEHSRVPTWFATEKGISYEEANRKYNDGITWKRFTHQKYGTTLIETSSADMHYLDIKQQLKRELMAQGVEIQERSDEDMYDLLLPKGSRQEKMFMRLIATFISLMKSNCKTMGQVLDEVHAKGDERSEFIIGKIFAPVSSAYEEWLREQGQMDFTDLILRATELCRTHRPFDYRYIIVDEFQDISLDRYNFLKVLRDGNPPAKLYCVGDDWQSIYRFSGSDMALFNEFPQYFGYTDIRKIETTYRFGEPLVSLSAQFIQHNRAQIRKDIHPANGLVKTELFFQPYARPQYCATLAQLVAQVPQDKSVFLLGRYSFDDYYLSYMYKGHKEGAKFYYDINNRKVEFLTVHKSKGLEADYVILLQCNRGIYGFPSLVSDDPVLNNVLTECDQYPYGEERRLFYVAITRAKVRTYVMYDYSAPSVFVDELLHPAQPKGTGQTPLRNANKRWTKEADNYLLLLYGSGRSVQYIAQKMGRSTASIAMRLDKLGKKV